MNYLKLDIKNTSETLNEIIIAYLADYPFNGFEEEENNLVAYIAEADYSTKVKESLEQLSQQYQVEYQESSLADKNWNAQWESDYQPVLVDDFCAVRATFHPPITRVKHEIVITPKMSFGTGHHATTYMMMKQMEMLNFEDKTVFDYGCGTGVLAVLAVRLGANKADAVDIDKWAYENTLENLNINNCAKQITTYCGEITVVPAQKYDFVLANINRNVLLDTMPQMAERLKKDGFILLSGFLESDIELIKEKALAADLTPQKLLAREKWRCLLLTKN